MSEEKQRDVINVDGLTWDELCKKYGVSSDQMFHRYNLQPEMLNDEGKHISFSGRGNYTGNIIFDKNFVLQKLAKQVSSLELVTEDDIDKLLNEVKDTVLLSQEKEREAKLEEVRKQLEELRGAGIDDKELAKMLGIKK